jgi:hypothetical protein
MTIVPGPNVFKCCAGHTCRSRRFRC